MRFLLLLCAINFLTQGAWSADEVRLWGASPERKDFSLGVRQNVIPTLENLLRDSTSQQDNRNAIANILTTSKLTNTPATARERLVITLSWYFLTQREKSKDFTKGFEEKIRSAPSELHAKHYRASAMMAAYLQLRAATGIVSAAQLDTLEKKFAPLFKIAPGNVKRYLARVETDMKKILPQIQPEAERFEITDIKGREPDFSSYERDFPGRDFAKTRHLVTVDFDIANNVKKIISPNLPDEYRSNPYAIYMRPLPKPQIKTVDLRIDAKPSLIYQILLVDKDNNQMIYGAVDPYAQNSDEMDVKAYGRYHKEKYHGLIPLSSGRETDDLKAKREKVEELLANWRGYLYPIQYFDSPEDLTTFNNSNLLVTETKGVLDNYQPQVKIKVSHGLSNKLGANHVPSVDAAAVEGYQPTMIKVPSNTFSWEGDIKLENEDEPYVWAHDVTSSLTGTYSISHRLVKVSIPYYLAGQNGMSKYALLALQTQCDIGWGEKAAVELSLGTLSPVEKEAKLLNALKQQRRTKMQSPDTPNHYYLIHSDLETTLHEVDPTVFKHAEIHNTEERRGIMSARQGLLDKVEKEKSYFYTTAVLYRYVPEKGFLVQDSAGVPAPDIITKKDELQSFLKLQFEARLVKEK